MTVLFGHSLDSGTRAGLPGSVPGGLGSAFALPRLFQRLASLARLTLLGTGIVLGSYALAARGQNDPLFDQLAAARNVQEADAIIKAQKLTPEEIAGASKARGSSMHSSCGLPEMVLFSQLPGHDNGQDRAEVAHFYLTYAKRRLAPCDILYTMNLVDGLMRVRPDHSYISTFLLPQFVAAKLTYKDARTGGGKPLHGLLDELWDESIDDFFFDGAFWALQAGLELKVPNDAYVDVAERRFKRLADGFLCWRPEQLDALLTFGKERLFHSDFLKAFIPGEVQHKFTDRTLDFGYPTLFNIFRNQEFETTHDQEERARLLTRLLHVDKDQITPTSGPPGHEERKEEGKVELKAPVPTGTEPGKEDPGHSAPSLRSPTIPEPLNAEHMKRYRGDPDTQSQYRADYESSVRLAVFRFQAMPVPGPHSFTETDLMRQMKGLIDILALRRKVMALAATNGILDGAFGELRTDKEMINMAAYRPYLRMRPNGTEHENVLKLRDGSSLLLTTMRGGESWNFANNYVKPTETEPQGTNKAFPTIYRLAAEAFSIPAKEPAQLRLKLAELHWVFANAMPYTRGTAAIAEMFIDALWRYHGYEVPAKAPGVNLDCEALARDEEDFTRHYPSFTPPPDPASAPSSGPRIPSRPDN